MGRRSLRERISGDVESAPVEVVQPMSPLAQRLFMALNHVADDYDELRMIIRGFEKMHRRNPWTDEELASTLTVVRDHITVVLQDSSEMHTA